MRKETKAMQRIKLMYDGLHLDRDEIYRKAKMFLTIYRDVVWATLREVDDLYFSATCLVGQDLSTALTYLSEFASNEIKQDFEYRVASMFETKWLIDLIDTAMIRIYNYHKCGKLYHEILSKSYLTAYSYTESEILEAVNLERSLFYDKKKEAVMLLGFAIWGYVIPQLQRRYMQYEPNSDVTPDYNLAFPD